MSPYPLNTLLSTQFIPIVKEVVASFADKGGLKLACVYVKAAYYTPSYNKLNHKLAMSYDILNGSGGSVGYIAAFT